MRDHVLRLDVPMGALSSLQLRRVSDLLQSRRVVRAHLTTRQNIELHVAHLEDREAVLVALAQCGLTPAGPGIHAFASPVVDPLAGVADDEAVDPRPLAALLMDWARVRAVFYGLPAKLKVALSGAREDRVGIRFQDVGLLARAGAGGEARYDVYVGGGLGRKPRLGVLRASELREREVLAFLHALVVVYTDTAEGEDPRRRRLGATVERVGADAFFEAVQAVVARSAWDVGAFLDARTREGWAEAKPRPGRAPGQGPRVAVDGAAANAAASDGREAERAVPLARDRHVAGWFERDVRPEACGDRASVRVAVLADDPLDPDRTAARLTALARAAEAFGDGTLRLSVRQDGWICGVPRGVLQKLHAALRAEGVLSARGAGIADVVACPGAPVCDKSNARTFDVAGAIREVLWAMDAAEELGGVRVGVSACMNGCGLHHASDIGLMGVSKRGEPHFQVSVGGHTGHVSRLGRSLGPALSGDQTLAAVRSILEVYLQLRASEAESLHATFHRVGEGPFFARVRRAMAG